MRKIICTAFAALILISVNLRASATDLVTVYQQALANDPTFQQAAANMWVKGKDFVPLARANLLPSLDAQGQFLRNYSRTSAVGTGPSDRNLFQQQNLLPHIKPTSVEL